MSTEPAAKLVWICAKCERPLEPGDWYCDCGEEFETQIPSVPVHPSVEKRKEVTK